MRWLPFRRAGTGRRCCDRCERFSPAYLRDGFPVELVEAAKRQEATAAELQKNSVSGLAMAWSQAVAIEGKNSPDEDLKAIEASHCRGCESRRPAVS